MSKKNIVIAMKTGEAGMKKQSHNKRGWRPNLAQASACDKLLFISLPA
jgi:ribosomal protein L28